MTFLDFSLADLRFRITSDDEALTLLPPTEYNSFVGEPGNHTPDAIYEARTVPATPAPPGGATVFWDNGIWRTRLAGRHGLDIDILDPQLGEWRQAAHVTEDFSRGELFVPTPEPGLQSIRPLYHPQDRAVVLGRVCHLGGVMMHSSSILADGKVLIFAGMSGAGKTTLARLWRDHGATILNDERNLIHTRTGIVRAGASPWHGEENEVNPATGPLAGIFFLNQAPTNRRQPLPLSESLPKMLTTSFIPVFTPDGPARTLEACHAILEQVPAFTLDFTPDLRALDLCRSVM